MFDNITKSFIKASDHLRTANMELYEAHIEIGKWRHPISDEILGIIDSIRSRIDRLEDLKRKRDENNG